MSANDVTARLKLTGQRAFAHGMRQVTDESSKTRKAFSRIGSAAKTMGKNVAIGAAGLASFGAVAAIGLGTKFISDAEESRKVGKLTEAVIKSTGKAAKISAAQVGDLAGSISNKTGVDDEAIQTGANMLLTFTRIRNEAGKGNKIFDRATQTITDMGAAMGKDPVKSAVMLGKALNDPVKGVSALSKVGVTFDDQQKKQIERYVKQGKLAKAQGVILDELAKEFGGAAAAQGTATDKLRVQFGNLSEDIGTVLLPYVDRFATWMGREGVPLLERGAGVLGNKLGPGIRAVAGFFERSYPTLRRWAGIVGSESLVGVKEGIAAIGDSVERNGPWLRTFFRKNGPGELMARTLGKLVGMSFEGLGKGIGAAFDGFRGGMRLASKFGRFTVDIFGKVLSAATTAFGWVPGLGDKLKSAKKKFDEFAIGANKAFDTIDATFVVKVDSAEYDRFVRVVRGTGGLPVVAPPSSLAVPPASSRSRNAKRGGAQRSAFKAGGATIVVPAPQTDVHVDMDGRPVARRVTTQQRRTAVRQ